MWKFETLNKRKNTPKSRNKFDKEDELSFLIRWIEFMILELSLQTYQASLIYEMAADKDTNGLKFNDLNFYLNRLKFLKIY